MNAGEQPSSLAILAKLIPAARISAIRWRSATSLGRPKVLPSALARRNPARVRSINRSRSSLANVANKAKRPDRAEAGFLIAAEAYAIRLEPIQVFQEFGRAFPRYSAASPHQHHVELMATGSIEYGPESRPLTVAARGVILERLHDCPTLAAREPLQLKALILDSLAVSTDRQVKAARLAFHWTPPTVSQQVQGQVPTP
jgi:hypothetical protein